MKQTLHHVYKFTLYLISKSIQSFSQCHYIIIRNDKAFRISLKSVNPLKITGYVSEWSGQCSINNMYSSYFPSIQMYFVFKKQHWSSLSTSKSLKYQYKEIKRYPNKGITLSCSQKSWFKSPLSSQNKVCLSRVSFIKEIRNNLLILS